MTDLARRFPHRLVLAAVLTAGLAPTGDAAAQWKWRDAAGRTQYSDIPPPPGVTEKDILQRPAAPPAPAPRATPPGSAASPAAGSAASAAPAVAPRTVDPELEARRKRVEQEAAEKQRAEEARMAQARAENCARAQEARRTVDSGVRMTRVNERGEREYLDDAARAAEGRKAQQAIDANCR